MEMRLPAAFYSIWNPAFHVAHPFQRIRRRMGFAERRAEAIRARRFGLRSIRSCSDLLRRGCLFLPVAIWRVL